MKKFTKMALAAAVAGFSFAAIANPIIVDDFSTNQSVLSEGIVGGSLSSTVSGAGIIGGWRDIYVSKVAGDPSTDSVSKINVSGGKLKFANDPDVNGTGIVRWDGSSIASAATFLTGINATGLQVAGLGVDFSSEAIGFEVTTTFADLGFPFTVNAYTDAANWTSLTFFSLGVGTFMIDFSDFDTYGTEMGGGADFSNIGALEVIMNTAGTTSAVDVHIDLVRAVPEPESLALVGLGLLGLAAARRRKAEK